VPPADAILPSIREGILPAAPAPSAPSGPALSLGRRLGAIFLLLTGLLLLAVVLVLVNLREVRIDARRVLEENREARLAYALVSTLDQLERMRPGERAGEAAEAPRLLVDEARRILDQLYEGPGKGDPSDPAHQSYELTMVRDLRSSLEEVELRLRQAASGAPSPERTAAALERGGAIAADLSRETGLEAVEATRDLERRVHRLFRVLPASGVAAVLALVLGFWLIERNLVRPVRLLRRGARTLAAGRLDHRVSIESKDEIGELAAEFNTMAERLAHTQRGLEQQVQERTRQFLHAARLAGVGTFAAGVAHEVNTPLATIVSCAEGLERRVREGADDRPTQLEYLGIIEREAERARELTAKLLEFARRDPGPVKPLQIGERARIAADVLASQIERRRLRLELAVAPDLPAVLGNGAELEQALLNVVKNAVEASPEGGTVRIRCLPHPSGVAVEVRDGGPGIPEQHREAVFDPFFTTKQPGEGTGLGLSLAYRTVEAHRGRIELESPDDGGTLVRIVLPAAGVAQPEVP
jgi:signal transduction histidine kinase